LVDLYGGTPSRVCTELLIDGHEFDLLAGVNLPMVIAAISDSGEERVATAREAAADGVVNVNNLIAEMENDT
ncbi:MAG: PTS sugar transporter subunit IIA, partial [Candidatus Microbacterium stercoravium]